MKVLMYVWELPPNISGGLGVACHGIIQGLLEQKIEVIVVLPGCFEIDAQLLLSASNIKANQKAMQIPFHHDEITTSYPGIANDDLHATIDEYATVAASVAKKVSHDVIHAHDWLTILAGIAAKNASHKPLIFHIHSLEVERCAAPWNKTIYDIEKYGFEQADSIIAVSEFTKQNIILHYQIPAEKITVVHNGLFKSQIRKYCANILSFPKLKTILFLGRITHQKAPFHFIEAARKVLEKRSDVQFVIAGDGDLFQSVVERVAELRLGTHIHFTRFLNRQQVEQIYEKSQVYVMPSIAEPFGLACLEALAQHVPVILSKQSGVSEVIQNILKVDFWDIDDIASKICTLIDSRTLQKQLIENAIPELRKLLWTQTAQKISDVYRMYGSCGF